MLINGYKHHLFPHQQYCIHLKYFAQRMHTNMRFDVFMAVWMLIWVYTLFNARGINQHFGGT